jgi:phosphopantothenoylcysteine decarboxylase / phosphopantothenate---cysteine ligase
VKKNVILGITGGIAAYKIPDLVRLLTKSETTVTTVLTDNAKHFVTKPVLATLTAKEPLEDNMVFEAAHAPHLSVVEDPSIMVIAPATANIIAKCAYGIADNLLSTMFLAYVGPKLIVPAMHTEMWQNPITQGNVEKLKKHGVHFLGPAAGNLACGDKGVGRMVDIELIKLKIESLLYPQLNLVGKKVLITCGGTTEAIDNVRVITNRSTGKLGSRLAHMAAFMGAEVTIVSTVSVLDNPHLKEVVYVESASDMREVVNSKIKHNDCLYMAAAVSDFTCNKSGKKFKRSENQTLELEATADILAEIGSKYSEKRLIGFCLEDHDLETKAKEKMKKKNLDYIVANTSNNIGKQTRSFTIYAQKSDKQKFENISLNDTVVKLLKLI